MDPKLSHIVHNEIVKANLVLVQDSLQHNGMSFVTNMLETELSRPLYQNPFEYENKSGNHLEGLGQNSRFKILVICTIHDPSEILGSNITAYTTTRGKVSSENSTQVEIIDMRVRFNLETRQLENTKLDFAELYNKLDALQLFSNSDNNNKKGILASRNTEFPLLFIDSLERFLDSSVTKTLEFLQRLAMLIKENSADKDKLNNRNGGNGGKLQRVLLYQHSELTEFIPGQECLTRNNCTRAGENMGVSVSEERLGVIKRQIQNMFSAVIKLYKKDMLKEWGWVVNMAKTASGDGNKEISEGVAVLELKKQAVGKVNREVCIYKIYPATTEDIGGLKSGMEECFVSGEREREREREREMMNKRQNKKSKMVIEYPEQTNESDGDKYQVDSSYDKMGTEKQQQQQQQKQNIQKGTETKVEEFIENSTFNLKLTEQQRLDRERVELPYLEAQNQGQYQNQSQSQGSMGGEIIYQPDTDDDWDEEDPDDDLEF